MAFGDYKLGDRGTGVADLQKYLREVGYPVAVDGVFGSGTRAAVVAFQRARGISADGIVGPQTLISLSQARAEGWKAPVAPVSVGVPTSPSGTSPTVVVDPAAGGVPAVIKPKNPWIGLIILVALAGAVWIFMPRKGGDE